MKKIISILLIILVAITCFVSCDHEVSASTKYANEDNSIFRITFSNDLTNASFAGKTYYLKSIDDYKKSELAGGKLKYLYNTYCEDPSCSSNSSNYSALFVVTGEGDFDISFYEKSGNDFNMVPSIMAELSDAASHSITTSTNANITLINIPAQSLTQLSASYGANGTVVINSLSEITLKVEDDTI